MTNTEKEPLTLYHDALFLPNFKTERMILEYSFYFHILATFRNIIKNKMQLQTNDINHKITIAKYVILSIYLMSGIRDISYVLFRANPDDKFLPNLINHLKNPFSMFNFLFKNKNNLKIENSDKEILSKLGTSNNIHSLLNDLEFIENQYQQLKSNTSHLDPNYSTNNSKIENLQKVKKKIEMKILDIKNMKINF